MAIVRVDTRCRGELLVIVVAVYVRVPARRRYPLGMMATVLVMGGGRRRIEEVSARGAIMVERRGGTGSG